MRARRRTADDYALGILPGRMLRIRKRGCEPVWIAMGDALRDRYVGYGDGWPTIDEWRRLMGEREAVKV